MLEKKDRTYLEVGDLVYYHDEIAIVVKAMNLLQKADIKTQEDGTFFEGMPYGILKKVD